MSPGIFFSLTAALIWATSSLLVKAQAERIDTLSFNAFRVVVGAHFFLLLLPFFGGMSLIAQLTPFTMLALAASVALGFCLGDSIYFWSMTQIGAARTMPISGVYPVFTWLLAVPILHEQVTLPAILGTVLVVTALYLLGREQLADAVEANDMLIPAADADSPSSSATLPRATPSGAPLVPPATGAPAITQRARYLAVGAAILAAFAWACATTLLRVGIELQAPVTLYDNLQQTVLVGAFRLTVAAFILVPIVQLFKGPRIWSPYRGAGLTRLIALGVYSTGIGSVVFVLGVALAGAARASLMNSASPILGVVFSWLFLRERVTRRVWFGTALAVAGVALVLV